MKRFFINILVLLTVFVYPSITLAGEANVTVRVDGLSCPFCAYGLEKKIKKMDGVDDLAIDIEGSKVEIIFKDREYVRVDKIEEAVKDAGFTPRKIEVKETGK